MVDAIITFRVDEQTHSLMKDHEEINWSAVLRNTVQEKLRKTEQIHEQDIRTALKNAALLRKKKVFDSGKTSLEILKEWRQKTA